ncbi:MAG: helicase, partial [Candidatus Marinimicrobia bacterium]|nr:helicase [Candidatus Neomarinimicrobiota bacterium]
KSMAFPEDPERKVVDLIWFPTGGGKTEAYLGLSAYTIFLKKLRDKTDGGTTVLMRYTLRLLTAQQYQRAAALIAACDLIRKEHEDEIGVERITIGLWAGQGLTPNTRAEAVRAFNALYRGQSYENPFIMLQCPWCGAQMGQIKEKGQIRVKGYFLKRRPSSIIFKCDNPECEFSTPDYPLPLKVIDEDIYESPPTLIIGTVDKFAILPWKPQARSIFGFRDNGKRKTPPELIIQDELHLISGPLGSMVGHYETLISELCTTPDSGICAKIIASTATISRAKEQCHALYNCGKENVFQFPPQCLEAGDSFFAYEDKNSPGRLYTGIYAASGTSYATTQIRVISSLLQGTKSATVDYEEERDYYWTILNYFNSLRELGHAATLISADIPEYLKARWRKRIRKTNNHNDPQRFIYRHIELTSRIPSSQIPQSLRALEINYPSKDNFPVDICLATNMISVGVDVQRLGLMTVIGQPKTTSEYIQATSRVGRSKEGPGLVAIIFNTQKPRDRSHYEHFRSYHARIYSQVEPTSVTPFSAPVRERALHAVLIGLIRYFYPKYRESPQPFPNEEVIKKLYEIIYRRVSGVDRDEKELTLKLLAERFEDWARLAPSRYGDFFYNDPEAPLMYQAGTKPPENWENRSWATPFSMRSVDADCEANVIANYLTSDEED